MTCRSCPLLGGDNWSALATSRFYQLVNSDNVSDCWHQFRRGLLVEAHRIVHHSTLGSSVIIKRKKKKKRRQLIVSGTFLSAGYKLSQSHTSPMAVKTDAPMQVSLSLPLSTSLSLSPKNRNSKPEKQNPNPQAETRCPKPEALTFETFLNPKL